MGLSKIREITTGTIRIWEEDGFVNLSRFTEKQDALLGSRGFEFHKTATSGIRFEFTTCGGEISFDYKAEQGCGAGQFLGFDITVDGVLAFHIYKEGLPEEGKIKYDVPFSETPVRIVAYFPNMAKIDGINIIPHFRDFYWDDVCCHPNDLGYFHYAHKVTDIIKKEFANV